MSSRSLRSVLAGTALVALLAWPWAAPAVEYVDLELVIATDVSYSIDEDEAALQRQGVAAAFRSNEVIRAIGAGFLRRIAVAYIDYSSSIHNRVVIDWRVLSDRKSARAFAASLLKAPPTFGRRTSISDAIELAAQMIATNGFEGTRRVIDVSGDGPNNWGRLVARVRDETAARGITINGLPIVNDGGGFISRYHLPDLDLYYRGCVIGGPGAFYVVARNFRDFARAIRKKLILEIAGLPPRSSGLILKASAHRGMPAPRFGYIYKRGCDIGERMRNNYWGDPDDS